MNNKKTGAFNLGGRGFLMVILSFLSCYMYSALTSDMINVMPDAYAGIYQIDANAIATLPTIAAFVGIITSIIWGKLMSVSTASKMWSVSMFITGIFAIIWSTGKTFQVFAIGYFVCYACTLASAMLLSYQVLAYWFPTKRGAALGIATAGFPLSAATTANFCGMFAGTGHPEMYFRIVGIIALVLGVVILLVVRDFPEEVGAYPDNNKEFDFETEKKKHKENLEYLKKSKWTVKKCLMTGRMWVLWVAVGATGFLSMGIMSNFVGKFLEQGYDMGTIMVMLAVSGVLAIPGSMIVGWLDVRFGTKKAGVIVNAAALIAVVFNLTSIRPLHFISLPILACMLGGSSNLMASCTSAIWGRYDFQNAFRVIQPLNSLMTGVGITVVFIIGHNVSYWMAYAAMAVIAAAGLIAMIALKVEPIDDEVR